ncbi:shikimate kinase [Clostridium cadaveris]|uniref:shikimate kinase n=1 Tax=Clostridium cadaveris TaxID=1529 RepID=UPI001E34A11A|nr:shikimate kinase [Clostridium cadaveris]UFH63664.1 shikimate kinase [Clostridium cadaveris]
MSKSKKNIVLIGMPGCGKSTIGKILADKLNYKYIDSDNFIEKKSGRSIEELFDIGEDYFRKIESQIIKEACHEERSVISTGGGVIKNSNNVELLKENGIVIFIDRPIENIVSDINISQRPLLKEDAIRLYDLYKERYDLYKKSCHVKIINDSSIEKVIDDIKNYVLKNNIAIIL